MFWSILVSMESMEILTGIEERFKRLGGFTISVSIPSIAVCRFPPGTSKWNKIEHRLFSRITQDWRGKPLISLEVIVSLIAATRTTTGLNVHSELDTRTYPKGVKVSDQEIAQLNLHRDQFHGEWNYEILPRRF
jgi:Rhodopirellula transposase DDE domain